MPILNYRFNSDVLNVKNQIYIVGDLVNITPDYKVIYLFHGLGGNETDFLDNTGLEKFSKKHNIIFITFSGGRSFYVNMNNGYRYYDYFIKEVFNLSLKLVPNINNLKKYTLGISMGGYGAFYTALNNLNLFNGIGSISGSLDIVDRDKVKRANNNTIHEEWKTIFGDEINQSYDLFTYLDKINNKTKIVFCCGENDHLIDANDKMDLELTKKNIKHKYIRNSGSHNWDYFELMFKQVVLSLLEEI